MTEQYKVKKLTKILKNDGKWVIEQFVLAALFLMVLELFKDTIVAYVEGFFSNKISLREGKIFYDRGEEFKQLIKESKKKPGQHSDDVFRAALKFFYEMRAITIEELEETERLCILRNYISHELFAIIVEDDKPLIKYEDVSNAFSLYVKTSKWWREEILGTTDPAFTQVIADDPGFKSESYDTSLLRLIIEKVVESMKEK